MTSQPPSDERTIERILESREGQRFETKRAGRNRRALETICAFANSDGGVLVIGVEDEGKAKGRDRLFGLGEKPTALGDLRAAAQTAIKPPVGEALVVREVSCTLRDGREGSLGLIRVYKSDKVHAIENQGVFVREHARNRRLWEPAEITALSFSRGTLAYDATTVDVPLELLDTDHWRAFREARQLTLPREEALFRLGLARREADGQLKPTVAAVLLFAAEPAGWLPGRCSVRVFHYRGDEVERSVSTNLLKPPVTVSGPIVIQIAETVRVCVNELATGTHVSPLGFEVVQRYPLRVLQEAITNAVLHRAYHLDADIHVRIFANRIEVESPGLLPGNITTAQLGKIGSRPRNRLLVIHARDFPNPPNLDAGEGILMMQETMDRANLYPPQFFTRPSIDAEAFRVVLYNEERLSTWEQVSQHLERHDSVGNAEVRAVLKTDNSVRVSKLLGRWVKQGLLVPVDPKSSKQRRRYRRADRVPEQRSIFDLDGQFDE